MNVLALIIAVMVAVLALDAAVAQQPDPAKLLPMVQAQRDAANNQIAFCAAQNSEFVERIKTLEAELAKLKPVEPPK